MSFKAAVFAGLLLYASCGHAASGQSRTLFLPHRLRAGETAFLQIQVGAIGPGKEIEVTTDSGQVLGTISPYGLRTGQNGGTYSLPVPTTAFQRDRIVIRLTLTGSGISPRVPNAAEVSGVVLTIKEADHVPDDH
jgi:hypothetical protein